MRWSSGSFLRVTTKKGVFDGVVIQRPPLLTKGFVVLKLSSGYNIGILEKSVVKVEKLKVPSLKSHIPSPTSQVSNPKSRVYDSSLPNVSILSTGGTISSKIDYTTGGVYADYSADDFIEMMPEISKMANISAKKVCSMMTEDITPKDWLFVAKKVAEELKKDGVHGVVVTCGTDTMHFISSALSFLLQGLNKPVIITGSQRSIDRGSSDAFLNLACAIKSAAVGPAGVFVCMHETIDDEFCILMHGARVRKMHTSRRDAFRPMNSGLVARVSLHSFSLLDSSPWSSFGSAEKFALQSVVNSNIGLLYAYPGMDSKCVDDMVKRGIKILVVAATALGHVPVHGSSSLVKSFERARKKGVLILITSQTLYGSVHPFVYTNLRVLSVQLGCTFLEGITPETAYVKAVIVGGRAKKNDDILVLLKKNMIGEFDSREHPEEFLS